MSRKSGIDAFCRECIADDSQPGTWRKQTENCLSKNCHLYPYRPVPLATPSIGTSERRSSLLGARNVLFDEETDHIVGGVTSDSKEEQYFVSPNLVKV
jgi:hypothetical protein